MKELEILEPDHRVVPDQYPDPVDSQRPDLQERRQFPRQRLSHRTMYGMLRHATDGLVDQILRKRVPRFGLLFLVIASVTAIWWTFHYRVNSMEANQDKVAERAALTAQLEQLKRQWSEDELNVVLEQISEAQNRVFADYTSLAAWLRNIHDVAQSYGLNMTYRFDEVLSSKVKDVQEVAMTFDVVTQSELEDGYLRVMGFVRELIGHSWYLEVHNAEASSEGVGLQSLKLDLHVWVKGDMSAGGFNEEVSE